MRKAHNNIYEEKCLCGVHDFLMCMLKFQVHIGTYLHICTHAHMEAHTRTYVISTIKALTY